MTLSPDRSNIFNSTDAAARLEQVLKDIVYRVEIRSDYSLTHPEHPSVELPPQMRSRFAHLPSQVRDNYLRVKLQQLLQQIYCLSQPKAESDLKIENQAIKWSQSKFLPQLKQNNHGEGYFEPGWQIIGETEEGFLQVYKDELTLYIRPQHLIGTARLGDIVRVKMPPHRVEPGYYIAVGNAGGIDLAQPDNTVVNIYLNLSSQGALAMMDSLTTKLNAIAIPFLFQVLYREEDYIHFDTATISLFKNDYYHFMQIIKSLYREHQNYFRSSTPLFTKYLAPGFSIAEQPSLDISLATHRFQIIAEALIAAWQQKITSATDKLEFISDRFKQEKIGLKYPYLNPGSKDIYSLL